MANEQIITTCVLTNADATIVCSGETFVADLDINDVMKKNIDGAPTYHVASITNDTTFELTSAYAGSTETVEVVIQRSFTTNLHMARPVAGDQGIAEILTDEVIDILDADGVFNSQNNVIDDGKYLAIDKVRARDGDGLLLVDDGDNGITIADGGGISLSHTLAVTGVVTLTTHLLPAAAGTPNIGSATKEFGNIYIGDDKKIYFGLDQDFSIEYDEDGNDVAKFDGADIDFSGYYALDLQNIPDLAASGAGLWFDGSNDYVNVIDDVDIDFGTGDFSLEIHFKPDNVTDANQFLINKEAGGVGYGIEMRTDDLWIRLDDNTADATAIIGTAVFSANTWVHVVVTFDRDGNAVAYINGKPTGTTVDISGSPLTLSSAGDLRIATETGAETKAFKGTIDFVHEWSCLLTAAEVKALQGAPIPYKYLGASQTELVIAQNDRDFETSIGNWTTRLGSGAVAQSAAEAHGGTKSMSFDSNGASDEGPNLVGANITTTGLTKGKKVRISFWVKGDASSAGTTHIYYAGTKIITLTGFAQDYAAWTQVIKEFTLEVDLDRLEFFLSSQTDNVILYFDDFSITTIGCVFQDEPDGIGWNQWRDKSGNELHGTISGAIPVNLPSTHTEVYEVTVTGETTFTLKKGYAIEMIVIKNTTANLVTNLDFGFSDAGGEIVAAANFAASGEASMTLLQVIDDFDADDTIYISSGNWNSASLDCKILMRRMMLN